MFIRVILHIKLQVIKEICKFFNDHWISIVRTAEEAIDFIFHFLSLVGENVKLNGLESELVAEDLPEKGMQRPEIELGWGLPIWQVCNVIQKVAFLLSAVTEPSQLNERLDWLLVFWALILLVKFWAISIHLTPVNHRRLLEQKG